VDNLSAHGTAALEKVLDDPCRHHVFPHPTPTHASWLNQVEPFFSILQRRLIRHGELDSVDDLANKVIAFVNDYNRRANNSDGRTAADRYKPPEPTSQTLPR
jgi:transposase